MKCFVIASMLFIVSTSWAQLPDAPVQPIAKPIREPFLADPLNRILSGTEVGIRGADAVTTYRDDGSGQCPTCYEKELPTGLAKSQVGMLAYSAAVSIGVNLGSRLLWDHGHKRLARLALIADIAGDGSAVVGNLKSFTPVSPKYRLSVRKESNAR